MKLKGVITGDIISSTTIKPEWRQSLLDSMERLVVEFNQFCPVKIEFFRGDSFQLLVDNPLEGLRIAVLLRAGLKKQTPSDSNQQWDARMALGIGSIDYSSEQVVISDGEAFHFSGWAFDKLGKRKLAVRTPWKVVNEELVLSTSFADDIISDWSNAQAQVAFLAFMQPNMPQKELAVVLNTSAQNISKLLSNGKASLISLYLDRYVKLIDMHLH